jgi:hypothetical protein
MSAAIGRIGKVEKCALGSTGPTRWSPVEDPIGGLDST